jgi:hypothetical protein
LALKLFHQQLSADVGVIPFKVAILHQNRVSKRCSETKNPFLSEKYES